MVKPLVFYGRIELLSCFNEPHRCVFVQFFRLAPTAFCPFLGFKGGFYALVPLLCNKFAYKLWRYICVCILASVRRAVAHGPVGPQNRGNAHLHLCSIPNLHSHIPMRNPVDRAIKAMTYGVGVVGLLIFTVFQLL